MLRESFIQINLKGSLELILVLDKWIKSLLRIHYFNANLLK